MLVARTFVFADPLGMHARAATAFARTAAEFAAEIEVEKDGMRVDGKAVIDLLTLVAGAGSSITVRGRGADAEQAVQALGRLIEEGFEMEAVERFVRYHADEQRAELPGAA